MWQTHAIEHLGTHLRRSGSGGGERSTTRDGIGRLDYLREHGRLYSARCFPLQWLPHSACTHCRRRERLVSFVDHQQFFVYWKHIILILFFFSVVIVKALAEGRVAIYRGALCNDKLTRDTETRSGRMEAVGVEPRRDTPGLVQQSQQLLVRSRGGGAAQLISSWTRNYYCRWIVRLYSFSLS